MAKKYTNAHAVSEKRLRILLAKPGLDGHDKGAKIVAALLRDAGIEVIYTGLRQSVEQIVAAAVQEDVDIISLSILSGAHLPLTRKLMKQLRQQGCSDIPVVLGGVIRNGDIPTLKGLGVAEVFPVGTTLEEILYYFKKYTRNGISTLGNDS